MCVDCSPYCKYCTGPTSFECTACFPEQHRQLIGTTCICDEYNYKEPEEGTTCAKKDLNKCSRGYIKIELTGECVEICGDGVLLERQCDDGNIKNGDGCSDQCVIEEHYVCSNEASAVSICKLDVDVEIQGMDVQKVAEENTLKFALDIFPATDAYKEYSLENIFYFDNPALAIKDVYYEDGKLYIEADYSEDVDGMDVSLKIKEDQQFQEGDPNDPNAESIFSSSKVPFRISQSYIPIKTANNLDADYYDAETYKEAQTISTAADAVAITGLVALGLMMFIRNSFGTLLILTNMQVVFLSLVAIDGMHPITESLTHLKVSLGYNDPNMIPNNENETSNRRVGSLGFDSSFANNFNVMLILQVSVLVVAGFLYLISQKRSIMKTPFKVFQRDALLLTFFNGTNFLFSISLMRSSSFLNICFTAVGSLITLGQIIHFLAYANTYHGMNETFNFPDVHLKIFLTGFLINRIGITFCLSLIEDDPLMSCIAAMAFQACYVIFLCIIRPFSSKLINGLLISSEVMTLGAFSSIYVLEGLEGHESTGGWFLLGASSAICLLTTVAMGYNIYTVCYSASKATKINPEKVDKNSPDASHENING